MPLIVCKDELKLKWTEYCVLSAVCDDNTNANPNKITFTIKEIKLCVPVLTLPAKDNQKLSKLQNKGFERLVYLKEYKTKHGNKNITTEYRYFLESNFVGVNRMFILVY